MTTFNSNFSLTSVDRNLANRREYSSVDVTKRIGIFPATETPSFSRLDFYIPFQLYPKLPSNVSIGPSTKTSTHCIPQIIIGPIERKFFPKIEEYENSLLEECSFRSLLKEEDSEFVFVDSTIF